MRAKCLKIGSDIITAELAEIDIDQVGNHVVTDIAPLEVEISIALISAKLKLIPDGLS